MKIHCSIVVKVKMNRVSDFVILSYVQYVHIEIIHSYHLNLFVHPDITDMGNCATNGGVSGKNACNDSMSMNVDSVAAIGNKNVGAEPKANTEVIINVVLNSK